MIKSINIHIRQNHEGDNKRLIDTNIGVALNKTILLEVTAGNQNRNRLEQTKLCNRDIPTQRLSHHRF